MYMVERKAWYDFICPNCGKEFRVYGNSHRKYCCHECYITVESENDINAIKNVDDLRLKTDIYKRIEERESDADISEQINAVIGNNITKVQGTDTSAITTSTPVLVRNADKVYRAAYLVSIKARVINFDSSTGEIAISDYDHYVMPLSAVFKDLEVTDNGYSDRLIFECDLVGTDMTTKAYNDFELQIFWENRELSSYSDVKSDQMGAIKDLVLSFARGY